MATTEFDIQLLLRQDTVEKWTTVNPVLGKGEPGVEYSMSDGKIDATSLRLKIGDGVSTWTALPYASKSTSEIQSMIDASIGEIDIPSGGAVYTVASLDEITGTIENGDIAIVTTPIAGDKVSRTAYVWDATAKDGAGEWVAFDGNYNAENVIFNQDLTVTNAIGTVTSEMITDGKGSYKLEATGKSLEQVLSTLLASEEPPAVDTPSAAITASGGSGEVGSTFTLPTATLTITDIGSYGYGATNAAGTATYGETATGITFDAGNVTLSEGSDNSTSNTDALGKNGSISLTATGSTTYGDSAVTFTFTGTAKYTPNEDVIPLNNVGNKAESSRLGYGKTAPVAITVADKAVSFTGYRNWYVYCGDNTDTIDSAFIRGTMTAKGNGKNATGFTQAVSGQKRVVIALPTNTKTDGNSISGYTKRVKACIDEAGMKLDIYKEGNFVESTVSVNDASGANALNYVVYDYLNPNGISTTNLIFTIS